MKTGKKIWVLILTLIMVLSSFPLNIFAEGDLAVDDSGAPQQAVLETGTEAEATDADADGSGAPQQTAAEADSSAEADDAAGNAAGEAAINDISDDGQQQAGETAASDASPDESSGSDSVSYPAKTFEDSATDTDIHVEAPAGAFPAGTTMKTEKVVDKEVIDAINESLEGDLRTVNAVDITFFDADGAEIQPAKPIQVTLKNSIVAATESPVVVHVDKDDDGNYVSEVIQDVETDKKKEELSFEARSFSIYLIGEEGKERRIYNFYDAEGTLIETQIVKNGEELIQPDEPDGGQNKEFTGWNTEQDGSGTDVTFGEITGISEEGEEWNVYPQFQTVYYVKFYDADNATVLETRKALEENDWTVAIDDLKAEPVEEQTGFAGWAYTKNGEVIEGTTVTASDGDVELYPVFKHGYWLYFDENDGGTGGGASYIPPEYVFEDGVTVRPEDPKRKGYTFAGWYKDAACTQPFTFGSGITGPTTIYAKWTEAGTTYSIIVWKEKASDTVGMSDDEKSYDYEGSVVLNASTGATVSVPNNPYKGYGGQSEVRIGSNTEPSSFVGFHYDRCDPATTVAGDGSTVLNVYYDRNEISITYDYPADESGTMAQFYEEAENGDYYFYNDPWDSGYYEGGKGPTPNARLTHHRAVLLGGWWTTWQVFGWPAHTHYQYTNRSGYYRVGTGPDPNAPGTHKLVKRMVSGVDYPDDVTWTGLFGQTFAETGHTWPSTYEVKYYQQDGSVVTNTVNTLWKEPDEQSGQDTKPGTILTFLDAFILPEPSETSVVLTPHNTGTVPVRFIQQSEDLTYPDEATNEVNTSGAQFLITDKYNGFKAVSYRTQRNGSWSGWTSLGSPDSEGVYARVPKGYQALEIRYERLVYEVDFHNGSESVGTVPKAYNTAMSDIETPTDLTYPGNPDDADHYTMIGWFADPELTTMVFFTEPTAEEWAQIQRDWEVTTYTVYDKMPANNLVFYAGWFKNWYNVTLDPNEGTLPQGQASSFWVEYGSTIAGSSLNQTTRDGYTLIGWMVETEDGEPWNFDTEVTDHLKLVAKWRSNESLSVAYDAGDGTGAPKDNEEYLDGAKAKVSTTIPTPPEGKRFVGWRVEGSDTIVYAGDTVTVSDHAAGEDRTLTLTAVYVDDPKTTSITFNSNYEGGPADIVKKPKALNEKIDLSEVTFERDGYELIGWDPDPNATTPAFSTTDKVGVDNNDPDENILYAIWKKTPDLTVTKTVNGEYADLTKDFGFTLGLKDSSGAAVTGSFSYNIYENDSRVSEGTISNGGTFRLKHNQKIVITGLPLNSKATVTETPDSSYETFINDVETNTQTVTMSEDRELNVRNDMKTIIITGVDGRSTAVIVIAVAALAGFCLFMLKRAKRRRAR